jgi:hypothetical protein
MRGLRLGLGIARGRGNSGPPVPAVITIVSVSTQESDGDVPVNYTIDKNDATVECVVFAAAEPNPDAADFGGANPTYVDQGTVSLTTSGSPINLTITGTFAGSVKLALLPTGGGDGDVVVSSAFTLDTTAPTISTLSPTDGATGVAVDANLVMTFSEAMKRQGTVDLRVVGGSLIESFDLATEGTWSTNVSGDDRWTGNPASDFTNGASLCVRWSGLEDTKGNALADNTGDTLWNFGVDSGVFDPADLFTSGRDGFVVVPNTSNSFESANNSDPAELNDGVQFQQDISGKGRNLSQGTAGRRPLLVDDGSFLALDFETDNTQFMTTATYSPVDGTNGVSVMARIKAESLAASGQIIASDQTSGVGRLWIFRVEPSGTLQLIGFNASGGTVTAQSSSGAITTGTWYLVCGIWTPTNARVWIDTMTDAGVIATSANGVGTVRTGTYEVGLATGRSAGDNRFDGRIAFGICGNWAFSEAERLDLKAYAEAL